MRGRVARGEHRLMRPRFFVEADASPARGDEITLARDDEHHARNVLRLRIGDSCEVVLGPRGSLMAAEVVLVEPAVVLRLGEILSALPETSLRLALVQALPDLRSVDVIVAKGTEVGVDAFVLVLAEGSPRIPAERLREREARWRRIALEAAKQSKQLAVPSVEVVSLENAVGRMKAEAWVPVVLEPTATALLADVLAELTGCERLALWVGPEGGWSEQELSLFRDERFRGASLGRRVLRAETAGPVAGAVVRFALGDW
jgi:16S rRNA (uracil1498-N3)-methyltransferase